MEQFDILNQNGCPTGAVADKGTALQDGQYYLGVHAYIYNSRNEFLLQQRAFDKEFLPGGWDIHMGHVLAGETSKAGVIREIREEIALSFDDKDLRFVGRVFWEIYHHIIDVYFLKSDFELNQLTLQTNEVVGVKVVSKEDMVSLVSQMDYRPAEYRNMVINEMKNHNMPQSFFQRIL